MDAVREKTFGYTRRVNGVIQSMTFALEGGRLGPWIPASSGTRLNGVKSGWTPSSPVLSLSGTLVYSWVKVSGKLSGELTKLPKAL